MTITGNKMKAAPTWQRVFAGLLSLGVLLSVIAQFVAGISPELEDSFTLFRLVAALFGLYLFSSIALTGFLPRWFLVKRRNT